MPQTTTWIGGSTSVAEVITITPGGTMTTGDVNNLPVTDEGGNTIATISFTTTGTTTAAAISAGLIAAWNANATTAALATASGSSTVVLTALNAGVPFYVSSSVTGVGTLSKTVTTANVGPNDWATAANWSTGVVPGNGDTVYINELAKAPILYGLNQQATGLTIYSAVGKSVQIGSASFGLNPGSGTTVYEGTPSTTGSAAGPSRIKYTAGTNAVTFYVLAGPTTASADVGRQPLQISGGASGTKIYVTGNNSGNNPPKLDVGMSAGQTGTVDEIDVSGPNAVVNVGSGITLAKFQASAGVSVINCAITTSLSTTTSANVTMAGAGLVATATVGGIVTFNNRNGGTIVTTLNVLANGTADFSPNQASATVVTLNHYAGGVVKTNPSNPGHIAFTTVNRVGGGTLTLS
jgi:hypothetical protein